MVQYFIFGSRVYEQRVAALTFKAILAYSAC